MKCLSLWQPWASLLVGGAKRVETRGRAIHHRGPLLIHAAKKWNTELWMICQTEAYDRALRELGFPRQVGKPDRGLPLGCIVGRVDIIACYLTERVDVAQTGEPDWPRGGMRRLRISATEREFGDYTPGRWAIVTANPVRFAMPIKHRGRQSLFEVPDSVLTAGGVS